jgi:hypothetical protein
MPARPLAVSLCITALAALASCQSSGRYGTPAYAGAAVGAGAVGAVASRVVGGCYAECLPGTHCNPASGLCERREPPLPASPVAPAAPASSGKRPLLTVRSSSYPAGHEYEVPPASEADAGCAPGAVSSELGDGGAIACELDGGGL